MTDTEMVHKLEKKFPFLSHIAFNRQIDHGMLFTCVDIESDSVLRVDNDGWVAVRKVNSKFWDVLGQIH